MKIIRTKGRGSKGTAEILAALESRGGNALDSVLPSVKHIVANVRKRGDLALLSYAAQFDGLQEAASVRVTADEMAAAWEATSPALRHALSTAVEQIRGFAQRQLPCSWNESPIVGLTTGQLVRPLASVGCYVPSGRHPLPSTLLMTAIPAQVAGVQRIVVVSPRPGTGNSRGGPPAGHHRVLSTGWSACDRRSGLWDRNCSTGRQDRWSRQSVRHCGQASGGFRLLHRHARGSHRDCSRQRTRQCSRHRF